MAPVRTPSHPGKSQGPASCGAKKRPYDARQLEPVQGVHRMELLAGIVAATLCLIVVQIVEAIGSRR